MNDKTPHILNAASNLLGFCFFVLATVKTLGVRDVRQLDYIVAITIVLLAISVFLSFLSIRNSWGKGVLFERYADYIFLTGVVAIVVIAFILLSSFV